MTLLDELSAARDDILSSAFSVRDGRVVPATADVGYNDAVQLRATYLYADMADSSGLVAISPPRTVGKILRLHLDLSVRIARSNGGHIRSFDGDRVMAIFAGDNRFDQAVKAAMQVKWACFKVIQPKIAAQFKSVSAADWKLRTGCGIASGGALVVRGGVRRAGSDLVSVGTPPNLAAKLSDVRCEPYNVRIDVETYDHLSDSARLSGGKNMWQGPYVLKIGGREAKYYRSSYKWRV